jgi:xylose isomerase
MGTTNLFGHPAFKDGAFTSNDRGVRRAAIGKAMRAIDLSARLGAEVFVFWGGREGTEVGSAKDPRDALERYREAVNVLSEYVIEQGYDLPFAIEPKPNEPRGDIFLPTVGHALHFITTLERPERVGVNPEVAHENMSGLSFVHAVAQAMECGKLFHIDLNAQKIGRYDQDLRFGSEDLKQAFLLVRLLEGTDPASASAPSGAHPKRQAKYTGPLHFDSHAYRTEDEAGVWEFARGSMRTYKMLAARARAFDADPEVRAVLDERREVGLEDLSRGYTRAKAKALHEKRFDADAIARRGLGYERLDQLLTEHLLGLRG